MRSWLEDKLSWLVADGIPARLRSETGVYGRVQIQPSIWVGVSCPSRVRNMPGVPLIGISCLGRRCALLGGAERCVNSQTARCTDSTSWRNVSGCESLIATVNVGLKLSKLLSSCVGRSLKHHRPTHRTRGCAFHIAKTRKPACAGLLNNSRQSSENSSQVCPTGLLPDL